MSAAFPRREPLGLIRFVNGLAVDHGNQQEHSSMATSPQNPTGSQNHARTHSDSPSSHGRASDGESIKDKASTLADEAKSEGQAEVEKIRGTAADKVDNLADSAKAAASELKGEDIGQLSDYISELAQSLGKLSSSMREKTGEDLLRDVSRLARDNPAMFVAGSIAIGIGVSRFAKASTPKQTATTSPEHSGSTTQQNTSRGTAASDAFSATADVTGSGSAPPYGTQTSAQPVRAPGRTTGNDSDQSSGARS